VPSQVRRQKESKRRRKFKLAEEELTLNTNDIRSKIHQVVTAISPLDKAEQEHICFVLDWIESGSDIFRIEKPATPETHLVSY
jgi:hypothetical protein